MLNPPTGKPATYSFPENLEVAYWLVVKDLLPHDIPIVLLRDAMWEMLGSLSSGAELAGKKFCTAMSGVAWDWPEWRPFAKHASGDTIASIAADVARMKPADVLDTALEAELLNLCRQHGIGLSSDA